MREIPILFSGPMVRAILEGRKTQTRRIVTPQPNDSWSKPPIGVSESGHWVSHGCQSDLKCPYGTVHDRLWIREAWSQIIVNNQVDYLYRADHHTGLEKKAGDQKWKPSIHMPKVASRITLEVTGVRVERLQSMSGRDVLAEGVDNGSSNPTMGIRWENMQKMAFEKLWTSINGPGSWKSNPFVWVIEFRRITM
jgi:hypothetical protein